MFSRFPRFSLRLALALVFCVLLIQSFASVAILRYEERRLEEYEQVLAQRIKQRSGISISFPVGESFKEEQTRERNRMLILLNGIILGGTFLSSLLIVELLLVRRMKRLTELNREVLPGHPLPPSLPIDQTELGTLLQSREEMLERIWEHTQKLEHKLESTKHSLSEYSRHSTAGAISAAIARSIRQPIRNILERAQHHRENPKLPKLFRDEMEVFYQSANQIERLVEGMERLRGTELPLAMGASLPNIVRNALSLLEGQIKTRGIEIALSFPESMPEFWGDETSLEQVVINLLSNAIESLRHSHSKRINIDGDFDGEYVILFVGDTGRGIEEENLQHIFEPFYSTKAPGDGNGLGLAISKDIIDRHFGKMLVKSEMGRGTQFKIKLRRNALASEALTEKLAA